MTPKEKFIHQSPQRKEIFDEVAPIAANLAAQGKVGEVFTFKDLAPNFHAKYASTWKEGKIANADQVLRALTRRGYVDHLTCAGTQILDGKAEKVYKVA